MSIDLSAPIWAIEHLAEAFHLSVDTAREHTYHHDFPAAKVGFARNLWLREEVLAWFAGLPGQTANTPDRRTNTGTVAAEAAKRARRATSARPTPSTAASPRPAKPRRAWPTVDEPTDTSARGWWKLAALDMWLRSKPEVGAVAWCDDHLGGGRPDEVRRRLLAGRDLDLVLIAPRPHQGLTPDQLRDLAAWSGQHGGPAEAALQP